MTLQLLYRLKKDIGQISYQKPSVLLCVYSVKTRLSVSFSEKSVCGCGTYLWFRFIMAMADSCQFKSSCLDSLSFMEPNTWYWDILEETVTISSQCSPFVSVVPSFCHCTVGLGVLYCVRLSGLSENKQGGTEGTHLSSAPEQKQIMLCDQC